MENLKKLQKEIKSTAWFGGLLVLDIKFERCFEGFYGKASEDWENRVTIEVKSPDQTKIKSIKVVGDRSEDIDDVAKKVLLFLN